MNDERLIGKVESAMAIGAQLVEANGKVESLERENQDLRALVDEVEQSLQVIDRRLQTKKDIDLRIAEFRVKSSLTAIRFFKSLQKISKS